MLSEFSKPKSIVCLLCQAWVSVRRGDKTRFFQHVSSDHEVHFDLELLFSLSSLQQTQKRSVVATINSLLSSDAACDELLLTDSEDAAEAATAVEASDSDDLSGIMAELKPSLQELEELRQVRQELRSTSVEGIQRWTRRSARRRAAGGGEVEEVQDITADALIEEVNSITSSTAVALSPQTQEDQGSQAPSKNLVRCSKCEKKMPRSELKSHIKEAHSRRSKAPAVAVVSCLFCDEKSSKANMSKHLKEAHGADDGYEKLMDEDIQVPMPKKLKVEDESVQSTEQSSQIIAEELPTKTVQVTRESIEAMRKSQTASTPPSVSKDESKNKAAENTVSKKAVHELSVKETAGAASSEKTEEKRRCCLCFEMYTQDALKAHKKEVHKHELDLLDLTRNWDPRFSFDECKVSCSEAACDLVFITEMSRDYHVSVRHAASRHVAPDTRVQKQCRVCRAKFSSSAKLDSHMKRKHATFRDTV